jgi:hypothetical protein
MSIRGSHLRSRGTWGVALAAAIGIGGACLPEQPRSEDAATIRALELREEFEGHRSWDRPQAWPERSDASGSHGRFVEIFASPEAAVVLELEADVSAWPAGSRFVAEGYDDEDAAAPYVVSVMVKIDDHWEWGQYEGEEPVVVGRPTACIGCHLAGDDLVRSVSLPEREE